jgi:DNA-binding transcriptional regulator PaaX
MVKPKTEELLNLLLWTCDMLARPTFRNLTESFESWSYRNGLHRQLAALHRQELIEWKPGSTNSRHMDDRAVRLTQAAILYALGGRDPVACWSSKWDGLWRLVVFDVPNAQTRLRNRLRRYLRGQGFGWLQNSLWVSPHPLTTEKTVLTGARVDVESLILLEARPSAGETDAEIVNGAWDFERINRHYARHLKVLDARPAKTPTCSTEAEALRRWIWSERNAWIHAVAEDPLLPERLLPSGYLGRDAWERRLTILPEVARQLRSLDSGLPKK